jgi:poly-beta-hydroxyalkanoate depolymerase
MEPAMMAATMPDAAGYWLDQDEITFLKGKLSLHQYINMLMKLLKYLDNSSPATFIVHIQPDQAA